MPVMNLKTWVRPASRASPDAVSFPKLHPRLSFFDARTSLRPMFNTTHFS